MQGIAALQPDKSQAGGSNISGEEAATLGRLLMKVSEDEIGQLRELSDELREFSAPELQDFLGGVDYLMANAGNYPQAVANLIQQGVVEPGDLPAEYVPTFFSILRNMIVTAIQNAERPQEFAKGGLVSMADKVRRAGRHGDTLLAHITPREAQTLKAMGGAGTINPQTGLPEFKSFFSKVGGFLKKAAPVILPVALNFLLPGAGAAVGSALGFSGALAGSMGSAILGAVGSGVGGLIAGQKPGEALTSALLGGLGSFAVSSLAPEGISGLMSGGGTGGEGAAAAAGGAGGAGGVSPNVPVQPPLPPPRPEGLVLGASPATTQTVTQPAVKGGLGALGDWVKTNPGTAALLAGGAGLMLGGMGQETPKADPLTKGVTGTDLLRQSPGVYGFNPEAFKPRTPQFSVVPTTSPAFAGGYSGQLPGFYGTRYAKDGGHISGPGTGTSDDVPAMLSDGEFVLTAKAVRGAGSGDRIKGAEKLYKLMNQLEKKG
jgi:hypothetical protein